MLGTFKIGSNDIDISSVIKIFKLSKLKFRLILCALY